jgi:hypothetical protein
VLGEQLVKFGDGVHGGSPLFGVLGIARIAACAAVRKPESTFIRERRAAWAIVRVWVWLF